MSDRWGGTEVCNGDVGAHELKCPLGRHYARHVGEEEGEVGEGARFDEESEFGLVVGRGL